MNNTAGYVVSLLLIGATLVLIALVTGERYSEADLNEAYNTGRADCMAESMTTTTDSVLESHWYIEPLSDSESVHVLIVFTAKEGCAAGRWLDTPFYRPDPHRIPKP